MTIPTFNSKPAFSASAAAGIWLCSRRGSAIQRREQNVVLTVVMDNKDAQPTAEHLIDLASDQS